MEDEKEMPTSAAFMSAVSNFALRLLPRRGVKMFPVNESIIQALATAPLLY